jgi:hypothetical protein
VKVNVVSKLANVGAMTRAELFSQDSTVEFNKEVFEFGDRLLEFEDGSIILEPYDSEEVLIFNSLVEYNNYLDYILHM